MIRAGPHSPPAKELSDDRRHRCAEVNVYLQESHSDAAVQRDSSQAHACSIQMVRVSEATLPGEQLR